VVSQPHSRAAAAEVLDEKAAQKRTQLLDRKDDGGIVSEWDLSQVPTSALFHALADRNVATLLVVVQPVSHSQTEIKSYTNGNRCTLLGMAEMMADTLRERLRETWPQTED
jgi:hypothetical protein